MSSTAQTISLEEAKAYADLLVQKEILNSKGKETLLREIQGNKIETEHESTVNPITYTEDALSKETILQFCASAFLAEQAQRLMKKRSIERKIKQEDKLLREVWNLNLNYMIGAKYVGSISSKRSTIGYTRTRTLKEIKEIGLITDIVFEECNKALEKGEITDEPELFRYMLNRTTYYNYYDFNRKEQEVYISQLVNQGILNEEGKRALLNSYKPFELKSREEILSTSTRYLVADVSGEEAEPDKIYAHIFLSVQNLLPEFKFEKLKTEIIKSDYDDLIRKDIRLTFAVSGNTYAHTFFYDFERKIPDPSIPVQPTIIAEDFHKGINKWLTDLESPYRLYIMNLPDAPELQSSVSKVGLLLLKEGEANLISQNPYVISRETFDNRLSRKNMENLIKEFKEVGIFSLLSEEQLIESEQKLFSSDFNSMEEALLAFPNTIVLFDWETGNLDNPYEDVTQQLAKASRGAFAPTQIVDEFKKGFDKAKKVKYGFSFNNKRYESILPFEGDWIHPDFMELIKKALKENNIDGDIYYCLDNGQEAGYIFLTSSQYQFIKNKYPDFIKN